jgi:hypothetical protein
VANNYLQFSEIIPKIKKAEKAWLQEALKKPDNEDEDDWNVGFTWEFESSGDFWIYTEEYGDPGEVARFVQKFLRAFRPNDYFKLSWAETCSSPRIGEFSGGAVFVTAKRISWCSPWKWIAAQGKKHAK